jgi:hypothetical protein
MIHKAMLNLEKIWKKFGKILLIIGSGNENRK